MALSAKRYTITAALPYTNGPIHIGHLAGVYVPADIYSRYLRAQQKDVAFICGSDEHGVAISIKAKKEGVTPKEIIDKYDGMIRKSFDQLGISFDNYSRTSAKIHHETASEIFSKMNDDNKFIEEITEQLYDPEAEQYLADRFVIGTCPKCNHTEAYGDQCEQCGSSLSATELINPKSTLSGADPILKEKLRIFDHISIYYLIAGSYAPVCLITLLDKSGLYIFIAVCSIAIFGTLFKLFYTGKYEKLSLALYLLMGWVIIVDIRTLFEILELNAVILLVLSGLSYTIGTIFYSRKEKYAHTIWHLFVLSGSTFHYFFVLFYII